MEFHLSEEQTALKDTVQRYVKDMCDSGARRGALDGKPDAGAGVWKGLIELGVPGLAVAEAYGGTGLGLIELAQVSEVLGYEGAPSPFLGHALASLAIEQGGSEDQKAEWLPKLASGEKTATIAFGEESDSWTPDSWGVTLSDGKVSGTKHNVCSAETADVMVVGLAGGGLCLVDARENDALSITPIDGLDTTRPIFTVAFDKCPAASLSAPAADRVFDAMLTLLAADAHGAARRCIDMTVEYASTRKQFGRAIGSFQALKHQLANITATIVPTDAMYWYAALCDEADAATRGRAAALAKAHIADRAVEAARICVELHGGIGYTWEYELHMWLKRAMFDYSYGGAPSVHRARAVALSMKAGEQEGSVSALF